VVVAREANARELRARRRDGFAERIEVLVERGALVVADRFRGAEVVGVGAAPAWPLRYGRSCSAASQPARDRGPQGRTRRQSAPRAAEGITVAPRLVLVARLGLGATEPWTSAIVATARACCRFESCERAHAARQPRNCTAR